MESAKRHHVDDGMGARDVYLDGKRVRGCISATEGLRGTAEVWERCKIVQRSGCVHISYAIRDADRKFEQLRKEIQEWKV